LLVIMMVLMMPLAAAQNFSSNGPFNAANGWEYSTNWAGNSPTGGNLAYASHVLTTAPSGKFSADVSFTINGVHNMVDVVIISAHGTQTNLEFYNSKFVCNRNYVSGEIANPVGTYHAKFSSNDGHVWHLEIAGITRDVTMNDVPAAICLSAQNNRSATEAAPKINSVSFVSDDTVVPTPVPTPAPAAVDNGPEYNPQDVQNFFDNTYSKIGSPYDTVSYNPDGTYTITKVYPTSSTHAVAGAVTGAADGKPIAGASVVLGDAMQKTDSLGNFKFEGIANGAADIAVSADGFASKTQSVKVDTDLTLNFALDKAATGGSTVANAANETTNMTGNVTMPANATMAPTSAPTTVPSPTQTRSPGFEGIIAAIAMIGAAGVLVYMNRKH
jgi:hypothetical protein